MMLLLLAASVAVVLSSAAATGLAASPSDNNSANNGTLGKGDLGKNKDFSGLVDVGGGARCTWSATAQALPRSCSYPALEAHSTTGPMSSTRAASRSRADRRFFQGSARFLRSAPTNVRGPPAS